MLRVGGFFRYASGLLVFLGFTWGCSSCRIEGSYASDSSYRLERDGYSPLVNTLLLVNYWHGSTYSMLLAYNEDKQVMQVPPQPTGHPSFFAWVQGQPVFVGAWDYEHMILYHKEVSGEDYEGTTVPSPVGVSYLDGCWNPEGRCLAVVCQDSRKGPPVTRLGLYNLKEDKFAITDVEIRTGCPLFWKDNTTLFAANNADAILELQAESEAPKVVQTIPVQRMSSFHGVFGGRPLYREGGSKAKLGDRTLIEVAGTSDVVEVIATETTIFVSASPTNLVAFDSQGREIDRTNPDRPIRFGSIGKDQNTVYGVAGTTLLCISVVDGRLNVREVCDLDRVRPLLPVP